MRRALLFVAVAFVAGLGIGFLGTASFCGPKREFPPPEAREADLAAIEKLHQEDIAATLSQDRDALANLWTEDAVAIRQPVLIGRPAIMAQVAKVHSEFPGFKVLTYSADIREVLVFDGWGFEWGHFEATFKLSADGPVQELRAPIMRVLKRQSDGTWKFHRAGTPGG